jgi:hypothetical protein
MDENQREERRLEALELLAEEVEKLRMLREHEMGLRVENVEGDLFVRPAQEE